MINSTMSAAEPAPVRSPRFRTDRRRRASRAWIVGTGALLLALLGALAGVLFGAADIAPTDAVRALIGTNGTAPEALEATAIVHGQRVPRTLIALGVGAALGCAGALVQGHTRNPLAEPGLLGITAGAACAVVLGVVMAGAVTPLSQVGTALLGAAVATLAVTWWGAGGGLRGDPLVLLLAGAALTAVCKAVTMGVVLTEPRARDAFRLWTVGSTVGRGWEVVAVTLPPIAVALLFAWSSGRTLDQLAAGVDSAAATGVDVARARVVGLFLVTVLAGAATAACGPLVFVGLLVPHAVRPVAAGDHTRLLVLGTIVGAALVVWCDVLGRLVISPGELDLGVVLALFGVPTLIVVLRRRGRTAGR